MAPPFMPRIGPSEGSRSAIITLCPARARESASPTVVVDLPSPAGVGDMAETSTTLPGARAPGASPERSASPDRSWPCSGRRVPARPALMPAAAAISSIGRMTACLRDLQVAQGTLLPAVVVSDIVVLRLVASAGVPAAMPVRCRPARAGSGRVAHRDGQVPKYWLDGGVVALQRDRGGALPAEVLGVDARRRAPCPRGWRDRRTGLRGRQPSPRLCGPPPAARSGRR